MTTDISNSTSNRIVIRLLNSSLRGCEFLLSPGRTLFVVGEHSGLVTNDQIPELPGDTLFIPLGKGGINFEVLFDEARPENIILRELAEVEHQAHERTATFNQILHVGELMIALRPEHLSWSSEIIEYPKAKASQDAKAAKHYAPTLLAIATVSVFLVGGFLLWSSPQQQANELNMLLGNEHQRFQVLPGRNKIFYIIAANERDAIWAQQVIARGDYNDPAKVINPQQENERVTQWLADNYPAMAYYRLQLDEPRQPQLWISRQRSQLSEGDTQTLSISLMDLLPYADRINIVYMDDTAAVRQAETELNRQALPFSRSDQANGVTFVIQGSLDDGELLRARLLIDDYYRQWGGRYVQFAIELKDNWLKGHSFQYGDQGYVKMSPGHWYFPKPL